VFNANERAASATGSDDPAGIALGTGAIQRNAESESDQAGVEVSLQLQDSMGSTLLSGFVHCAMTMPACFVADTHTRN